MISGNGDFCESCGSPIESEVLSGDGICIKCYLENPGRGEATRRSSLGADWESIDGDPFRDSAEAYLADVEINELDDAIDRLLHSLKDADTELLAGEAMIHLALCRELFHSRGVRRGPPPQMVEYLLAAAASIDPVGEDANFHPVLRSVRDIGLSLGFNSGSRSATGDRLERQRSVGYMLGIRELIVGRIALPEQHLEAARRLYSPFDDALAEQYGFEIDDAVAVAETIREEKAARDSKALEKLGPTAVCGMGLADRAMLFRPFVPDIADELSGLMEKNAQLSERLPWDLYWVPETRLVSRSPLPADRTRAVLTELSVELGDAGEFGRPDEHNPLHEFPLLASDSRYLLPPKELFEFALAKSFYYRLRFGIGVEKDRIADVRGNVTEAWTRDTLQQSFGDSTVLHEVDYDYPDEGPETDVLLKTGNTLFIFECKAKMLTLDTRAGDRGDLDALQVDIEKSIGEGYQQAYRLMEGIENGEIVSLTDHSETIDVTDVKTFHLCPTTLEPFDMVTNHGFKEFIDIRDRMPYPVSVYDLEAICANMESARALSDYFEWRTRITANQSVTSGDEMDYLQLYLDGTTIPDTPEETDITGVSGGLRESIQHR